MTQDRGVMAEDLTAALAEFTAIAEALERPKDDVLPPGGTDGGMDI